MLDALKKLDIEQIFFGTTNSPERFDSPNVSAVRDRFATALAAGNLAELSELASAHMVCHEMHAALRNSMSAEGLSELVAASLQLDNHSSARDLASKLSLTFPLFYLLKWENRMEAVAKLISSTSAQLKEVEFDTLSMLSYWVKVWSSKLDGQKLAMSPTNVTGNTELLSRILTQCVTKRDLAVVCYILYNYSIESDDLFKVFNNKAASILMKGSSFRSMDPLAMYCACMFSLNGGVKIRRRDLQTLIWQRTADEIKRLDSSESNVPTSLGLCIKQAAFSMDRVMLKSYPYLVTATMKSIEEIIPAVMDRSLSMSVRIIHGMLKGRHVDSALLDKVLHRTVAMDWSNQRSKEVCTYQCRLINDILGVTWL